MVGSRANAVVQRGKMESSLYKEVWAIRRRSLILSLLPGSVGKLRLEEVSLHLDTPLLPWAPLCGHLSSGMVRRNETSPQAHSLSISVFAIFT